MTESSEKWLNKAETLGREVLGRHANSVDRQGRWPAESIDALRASGLLGLTVPAAYGGAGEGPRTFVSITRMLAEHCASTAMIYLMHTCATQTIAASERLALREELLRSIAAGRHVSTLAFSEKGSRSHFWAPVSQAVHEGDDNRLSADKSFVTGAGRVDSYIVSARSPGASDPMASTLYYFPKEAPGITVGEAWDGLGLRGNASAPMRLDRAQAPASHQLCDDGAGFSMMMSAALPLFQVGSAAVSIGIARAATEGTRLHLLSTKFEHLGQTLASLPTLRARLARMHIAVGVQQSFLEHVAGVMETPGSTPLLALLESKASAADAAAEVTDLAMRVCGGAAFGRRLTVERNFRDARAAAIMAPTTDVLHDFIAKTLLDMPLF
ncbi:MAG: acyl-CoA dehydrogenase family protein [Gemmataceae bacterium]